MKLTFLGTGTSTGVPQLNCSCKTCTSADPRDHRFRSSAFLEISDKKLLIDCGPDFYTQMLHNFRKTEIDAAFLTHSHYDHVGGIDDLRPYCFNHPFPLFCTEDVATDLRNRVPYCFRKNPYPGVPSFEFHIVTPLTPLDFEGIEVLPLPVLHGKLPIVGYRFNSRIAYLTDAKTVPDKTIETLRGIDTLVINSLRLKEHHSHMNLFQTLDVIREISPRKAYLIHLSHDMGTHSEASLRLPENVEIAYDGLTINISD